MASLECFYKSGKCGIMLGDSREPEGDIRRWEGNLGDRVEGIDLQGMEDENLGKE